MNPRACDRNRSRNRVLLALATFAAAHVAPRALAQIQIATSASPAISVSAPATPRPDPARTFHDSTWRVSFDYPATWNFAHKDRELSTFHLDARSAPRSTTLRAVTAIPENPFPASTFSGAYVYLSVTPHASDASCARQAVAPIPGQRGVSQIAGVSFVHGHDEQRDICITERDEIYTTYRRGACYRFDLAMNNFCGGAVSGVKDVTQKELETIRARMEAILATVRFDPK